MRTLLLLTVLFVAACGDASSVSVAPAQRPHRRRMISTTAGSQPPACSASKR
jgi:hypothetical protein